MTFPSWMRCADRMGGICMERLPELQPGRYRHFKGNEYELLYVARHSETLEPMVVYRALYGERGIWVRPASMWERGCGQGRISWPAVRSDQRKFDGNLTARNKFQKNSFFLKLGVAFC